MTMINELVKWINVEIQGYGPFIAHVGFQQKERAILHMHCRLSISSREIRQMNLDVMLMFNGNLELYFDWILKLENVAPVTKQN